MKLVHAWTTTVVKTAFYIFPDELHRTSTVVKIAFNVPTDTQTCRHEFCRTSTVVKLISMPLLPPKHCDGCSGKAYKSIFTAIDVHSCLSVCQWAH